MNSPKDPLFCDPEFWKKRYDESGSYEKAIQQISDWGEVNKKQGETIKKFVYGKVFDAGCGVGRIVDLLEGVDDYVGMDITPMFIEEAQKRHPNHKFILGDMRNTGFNDKSFDWGIAIGMADSIYWSEMEKELKRICKKILILWCEKPEEYLII